MGKKPILSGLIGNILEHYDSALFALLAPFIAPLFFHTQDPITALILTYALIPAGFITKPLGALFFGYIGDRYSRKKALFYSLIGMAFVTASIGFLPTAKEIGAFAPVLLMIGRMAQGFFAAGESSGGAIFILEHAKEKNRSFLSSIYGSSSILGILLASFAITIMSLYECVDQLWRCLFWAGGLTAILGLFIRLKAEDPKEFTPRKKTPLKVILKTHRVTFCAIILASGFSQITFSLSFTLMNGLIPLITPLSKASVMQANTALLVVDMFLLPVFGHLSSKLGKEKVMLFGAVSSVLTAIPLFSLLPEAGLTTILCIRFMIIFFGVIFAAPFHAWGISILPKEHRYLLLSLGSSLGSKLIGAPATAISLLLYKETGLSYAPAFYLILFGTCASIMVYLKKEKYSPSHAG